MLISVKLAEMMKEKKHLTKAGLEEIKKIKAGMNKGSSHVRNLSKSDGGGGEPPLVIADRCITFV